MIFDTNALSWFLKGDRQVRLIAREQTELAVPAIVLGEYLYGLQSSNQRIRLEGDLHRFLAGATVLDVNIITATYYALVRDELRRIGKPIPSNDVWIAALARQHNLPVLSRDAHFDAVAGVERIAW